MLVSLCGFSQKTFLMIYKSDHKDDVISYPPGTPFELRDADDNLIFTEKNFEGEFKIKFPHTLFISPSWKKEKDIFKLTEGFVVVELTEDYFRYSDNNVPESSHGVTVNKTLIRSGLGKDTKNVKLEFSNGIIFTYIDGKAAATLKGKPLKVENKYLIYSELGIIRVSYNPKSGTVWWVFEPAH